MDRPFYYKEEPSSCVVKIWSDEEPDQNTLQQFYNVARLPFVVGFVAGMPDFHYGYGVPIGCVFGTKDVIIPNAVGKDIGCGAKAFRTDLKTSTLAQDDLRKFMLLTMGLIPTGSGNVRSGAGAFKLEEVLDQCEEDPVVSGLALSGSEYGLNTIRESYATLGGGNHFCELAKDDDDNLWVVIHTGSRNLGAKVADHYDKLAKEMNEKYHSKVDPKYDLAFLPMDSFEGESYYREMRFCLSFAFANRLKIANIIQGILFDVFGDFRRMESYDVHHNYAAKENHLKQNLMIHRKGAVRARRSDVVIIPGSQGTGTYIAKGLENSDAFHSSAHGSGRAMGRAEAKRSLDLEAEKKKLEALGIIHSLKDEDGLEEADSAYKNLTDVMEHMDHLVQPTTRLYPILNIKGEDKIKRKKK